MGVHQQGHRKPARVWRNTSFKSLWEVVRGYRAASRGGYESYVLVEEIEGNDGDDTKQSAKPWGGELGEKVSSKTD